MLFRTPLTDTDVMAKLSTHVLDTHGGKPAAAMTFSLWFEESQGWQKLGDFCTNSDGRCDQPLLQDQALRCGVYQLRFEAEAYYRQKGVALASPGFVNQVVLQFGIADATQNYHVPLLLTPWSYSTYRGS